jgi:hypothetical protein
MRKNTFEKKKAGLNRVMPGRPSDGLTRQINHVSSGFCLSQSFTLPRPVQPLNRLAGPGLIPITKCLLLAKLLIIHENPFKLK